MTCAIVASVSSRGNPSTSPMHIAYSRASPRADPTPAAAAWPEARTARMFGIGSSQAIAAALNVMPVRLSGGAGAPACSCCSGVGLAGSQHAHPGVNVLGGADVEVDSARVAHLLTEELGDRDADDAPDELVHDGADRQPVIPVGLARPPVRDLRREPRRHHVMVDDLFQRELRLHPGDARLVRQRDADRDVALAAAGELGPVTADRGVQVKRAPLDKQRDADAGDSLGA